MCRTIFFVPPTPKTFDNESPRRTVCSARNVLLCDAGLHFEPFGHVPGDARAQLRRRVHAAAPAHAPFSPIHYERRYAYPLVIWLHGDGGSERELRQVLPLVSVRNYVGAAVRGLPLADGGAGYAWRQSADSIDAAADGVDRCIELAQQRFNVHPERIFLVGHGSGGTMALRLALESPTALAGAASLNGPLPRGNCPLARVNAARRLPLLMMTCNDGARYPASRVVEDLRLLHAGGFSLCCDTICAATSCSRTCSRTWTSG